MEMLRKSRTGIKGFDEITVGGIPHGRTTLVCGGPGCGKTLFAMEFIVRGATEFGEPGLFVAFEEKTDELTVNVSSLGFDLNRLIKQKKIRLDHVLIERQSIEETGEYDLDGLFIRIDHAARSIGAKRVVLDTIENLFVGLKNKEILRAELKRLFDWLKQHGFTAVITGEQGEGKLTRHGLEEYVSDCVVMLDHRVENQISTRRLRIIKYRGSIHGTNEYPFLIDKEGISVLPVTSVQLNKKVSSERISTGIPSLDAMFGGKGFFRASSILVSGSAGTGKTSIAGFFANATCMRKERCLFFAFEESPQQIIRNMKSINLNLQAHVDKGLLHFHSARSSLYGLEMHLATMYKLVKDLKPKTVILDPISNLVNVGAISEVNSLLMRLLDFLQEQGITVMITGLTKTLMDEMDESVSSLVDTWISLRDLESNGERNRALYVIKSRGMSHSNQVREFVISGKGIDLVEIYIGPNGVLVGSARKAQKFKKLDAKELEEQEERSKIANMRQGFKYSNKKTSKKL